MSAPPTKVLITGGKPAGGVASFAEGLRAGFEELGIPVEVIPSRQIFARWRELRDPSVLKILSLTAAFAAPVARRAICVAHGFPCAEYQGWLRTLAILASLRLATASKGAQLVVVSNYSALHLKSIFALQIDAIIHNPVNPIFLEQFAREEYKREAITYIGRLDRAKHVDELLPAMHDVLRENPGLRAWIIGAGAMRPELERIASGDERIEFLGPLAPLQVRERLRRSLAIVSGNPTEPFGIVYLEALSQGCAIAMPASGGGLEIAPELIGKTVQLFPASSSRHEIARAIRTCLSEASLTAQLAAYSPRQVAENYLNVDTYFSGTYRASRPLDGR